MRVKDRDGEVGKERRREKIDDKHRGVRTMVVVLVVGGGDSECETSTSENQEAGLLSPERQLGWLWLTDPVLRCAM